MEIDFDVDGVGVNGGSFNCVAAVSDQEEADVVRVTLFAPHTTDLALNSDCVVSQGYEVRTNCRVGMVAQGVGVRPVRNDSNVNWEAELQWNWDLYGKEKGNIGGRISGEYRDHHGNRARGDVQFEGSKGSVSISGGQDKKMPSKKK